jgi:pimeloyl-ACP methyl ester carboxylesterase
VGNGRPLLYVPGIEGTGRMFYRQIEDLQHDHRILSYTFPGDERYGLERLISDLEWIIDDAGVQEPVIIGESFGGLVAMAAAIAKPQLFAKMILLNTFPWFMQRAKIRLGVALFSLLPYSFMKWYRTRNSRDELFGENVSPEHRQIFHKNTRIVPREGYISRLRIIRDTDLRGRLGEICIPTLIAAGTHDRLFNSVNYARMMESKIPNSMVKLLEGCGHVVFNAEGIRVREWLVDLDKLSFEGTSNSETKPSNWREIVR